MRKKSQRQKRRREYTDLGFDLDEREEQVVCHAYLHHFCERQRKPFIDRFFHFSRPTGFKMAFDAAERNERFGRIQCQRSKESSSKGIETSIPQQKDSES